MEHLRGVEALKTLPLTEVLIPYNEALEKLTERTQAAIKSNFALVIENIRKYPQTSQLIQKLNRAEEYFAQITNGGFSLKPEVLESLYKVSFLRSLSFKNFFDFFWHNIVPEIYQKTHDERKPGVVVMGYLLDFLNILNPKIATFEDGVEILVMLMREKPSFFLNPFFIMGTMVDDGRNLRTLRGEVFDPFMSVDEVNRFDEVFLSFLNDEEKRDYERGKKDFEMSIKDHEQAWMRLGTTLN